MAGTAVGIIYFIFSGLSLASLVDREQMTPFWLASGLSLALLTRNPPSSWPILLGGIALACLITNLAAGYDLLLSAARTIANLSAPVFGAILIRHYVSPRPNLQSLQQVFGLTLIAVPASGLSAVLGTLATFFQDREISLFPTFHLWFIDDYLGILLITPLILVWWPEKTPWLQTPSSRKCLAIFGLFGGLIATSLLVFYSSQGKPFLISFPYWSLPCLFWIAVRFGLRGATVGNLILAFIAVVSTLHGMGPFASSHASDAEQLVSLECFITISLLGTLFLAANLIEQRQVEIAVREREEQLRQSQKMEAIGHLAGGVAHDFNNLLTVIHCNADDALFDLSDDAPLRGNVEEILAASERGRRLTSQLLAFSRKQVLSLEILNLNEIISHTKKMLLGLIGDDIEITMRLDPVVGYIKADAGQIEQILLNLAVNARDAMPKGGHFFIRTSTTTFQAKDLDAYPEVQPGSFAKIEIGDTGCGIEKDVIEKIFAPFFTTKGPGKGTGLGLATVHGIVTQHKGFLRVESTPSVGTTFKIFLPRLTTELSQSIEVPKTQILRGIETILVVEDNEQLLKIICTMLKSSGYKIIAAASPAEALHLTERTEERIQLLLTDVIMPGMSGKALYEKLLTNMPHLKVLYMSGYTADYLDRHGPMKEIDLLQKPFSKHALTTKLREVLGE